LFADQGAHISVLDFNPDGANVVKELKTEFKNASFSFHQVDISKWDELATVFQVVHQQQGRIDVVMANAGISKEPSLLVDEKTPSKPGLHTLDVNLTGTIYSKVLCGDSAFVRADVLNSCETWHPLHQEKCRCERCNEGVKRLDHLYSI
jgi:NAD(P)-dependent dehydrogenase (short-subunit alcohol dehydrogenase family)